MFSRRSFLEALHSTFRSSALRVSVESSQLWSHTVRLDPLPCSARGSCREVTCSPRSNVADDELEIEDFAWDDAKKVRHQ